jgi:hypothetical protein
MQSVTEIGAHGAMKPMKSHKRTLHYEFPVNIEKTGEIELKHNAEQNPSCKILRD